MTPIEMLAIKFVCDDLDGEVTIREYLCALLDRLWEAGEGFSGKRPFGNSGWEGDLYRALVIGGAIKGELDDEGYLDDYDHKAGNKAIFDCIACLRAQP